MKSEDTTVLPISVPQHGENRSDSSSISPRCPSPAVRFCPKIEAAKPDASEKPARAGNERWGGFQQMTG
ncbi:MAG TPA: hypothetical protein PLI05_02805 [Methanotrichaceae archaeon]|nr:hypothetical protein [Methanotrichaceae archaeon]HQI90671.1 hypothetical protein [Methanotrichaceae archaeon]